MSKVIRALALLIALSEAHGQVTITGTVRTPTLDPWEGEIRIQSQMMICGGIIYPPTTQRVQISGGILNVSVQPTDVCGGGTGYSYKVYYMRAGKTEHTAYWVVPSSPPQTTVDAVQTSVVPTTQLLLPLSQLGTPGPAGSVIISTGTGWVAGSVLTDPTSATGDLIYRGPASTLTRLPLGSAGQVLSSDGSMPAWTAPPGGAWGSITGMLSNQMDLQAALDAKAGTVHVHDAGDIVSGAIAAARLGNGAATSSTFLRGDSIWAGVDWASIVSKPSTFQPSSHTHTLFDLTQSGATVDQIPKWNGSAWVPAADDTGGSPSWGSITGTLSDQADLWGELSGKAAVSHTHSSGDLNQSGATSNQALVWSGAAWIPANVANSVFGRTGAVTAQSGDYASGQVSHTPGGNIAATNVQDAIAELDSEKAAAIHTHLGADIVSGMVATARLGSGAASSSTFLRGDQTWNSVGWNDVSGKPSTFPPASHTHPLSELSQSGATAGQIPKWNGSAWAPAADDTGGSPSWGNITGTLSNQTDLQSALDAKAGTVHVHDAGDIVSGAIAAARLGNGAATSSTFLRGDSIWAGVDWASIVYKPSTFPPSSHTHPLSELSQSSAATGQIPKWNGTAWVPAEDDVGSSAVWGSITGTLSDQIDLQTALDGKASTSHTHAASDTTSGVFAPQRLGTGTPSSANYLRGDGVWAALPVINSNLYVQIPAAACQLFGASTSLTIYGPVYPMPTCRVGSNLVSAVLDFYDTDSLMVQGSIVLAGTFSAVNLVLTWDTQATTGDVVWQVQTACVADGEAADPSWNAAQTIVDAAQATAGARNEAVLTNVTVTGCAPGETMYWRLTRDPAHASDTIAATASLHHLLWEVVR